MSIGRIFGRRCESFCSQLTNNAGYYFNRFWGREKPEGFFRSGGASKQNPLVSWLKKTVKDIRGFWDGCFREGFMPQVQKAWENARRFWGDCWGVAPNGTKAVEIPLDYAETVKPDEVKIAERKFFGTTVNSSESLKAENNIISPFITEKIPPEQNVFFHEDMFEDTLKFDRDIAETRQKELQEELRQVVEDADWDEVNRLAAQMTDKTVLKEILSSADANGGTPLAKALITDDFNAARSLLGHGVDPNALNGFSNYGENKVPTTLLHELIMAGNEQDTLAAIEFFHREHSVKPDFNLTDDWGYSPLYSALLKGQTRVAEAMLESGEVALNQPSRHGFTVLNQFLFNAKSINNEKALQGWVEHLIQNGADPNIYGQNALHPLCYAVQYGQNRVAEQLLPHINLETLLPDLIDNAGQKNNDTIHDTIKFILDRYPDTEILRNRIQSADLLSRAEQGKRADIVETLMNHLSKEDPVVSSERILNSEEISPYIIHEPEIREPEPKNIIEPEPIIDKSLTPRELTASSWEERIYQAVETGDLEMIEAVEKEARAQGKNLKTILPALELEEEDFLQQAVKTGNLPLLEKLLAMGANPATQNELGYNAFHMAAEAGCVDALEPLLNAVPSKKRAAFLHAGVDNKHLTALHLAAGEGHIHVIDTLKKLGVDVNIRTQYTGEAALHTAAKRGQLPVLKRLKQLGAQLDIRDVLGNTPMHDAVLHHQPTSIETLHQLGVDLTALNEKGKTPVFLAASRGSPESMRTLLKLTAHDPAHHSMEGWTLLHEATFDANLDNMRELIRLNKDQLKSVASDKRGIPMDVAIKTDNPAAVETLLENGVPLTFAHVMQAAEMGSPTVLEALLKMRPDWLNAPSAQGSYLLHGAAFNGKVPTIQKLLELGARPDVALLTGSNFAQGSTALHMAASMGELEAAKILLEAEPNLLYRTNENLETVLHEAACQQRPEMCQFLSTQAPELLTRRDKYGKLPLDTLQEARQLYQAQHLKTIRPGEKAPKKLEVEQVHLLDNLIQDWARKTAHLHPTVRSPISRGTVENHFSARPKQQFNNAQSGNGVPVGVKPRFLQLSNWFRR